MPSKLAVEFIQDKKRRREHTPGEIAEFIHGFLSGQIPDYQVAAWLMAVYFNGLSKQEMFSLTTLMRDSGRQIDFSAPMVAVDKHSTGGIGDKTSLIVGPVVAAAGGFVPMMAGRGLGHSGGTIDKLESYKEFNIRLSPEAFVQQVREIGIAIIGQTDEICPADKRLYALRDVTATVDCLELIAASIMSKKLAEGIGGLCMDVKFGRGAFMKSRDQAEALAHALIEIGRHHGLKISAVLSSMNQPLGRSAGNAIEVQECIDILKNEKCLENGHDFYASTRELSLVLASHMLKMCGVARSLEEGHLKAQQVLSDGSAYEKFLALCRAQGVNNFSLPKAPHEVPVLCNEEGYVEAIDTEKIGYLLVKMGAGRTQQTDTIDPAVGLSVHFRIGDLVKKGQILYRLFGSTLINNFVADFQETVVWSTIKTEKDPLVTKIIEGF